MHGVVACYVYCKYDRENWLHYDDIRWCNRALDANLESEESFYLIDWYGHILYFENVYMAI